MITRFLLSAIILLAIYIPLYIIKAYKEGVVGSFGSTSFTVTQ